MAEDRDMAGVIELDGPLLAAARALAGLTVRDLAKEARTTRRIVSNLEQGAIRVADRRRHGHTSPEVWGRIVEALGRRGVEFVPSDPQDDLSVAGRLPVLSHYRPLKEHIKNSSVWANARSRCATAR